jgi:hypothetical protein
MKHIYINKPNEWNIFTYIVIITHDNISTIDLYTGNFYARRFVDASHEILD